MPATLHDKRMMLLYTYIIFLFHALHYAIPIYVANNFLSDYLSPSQVSLIFLTGAVLTILIVSKMSSLIRRYHNYKVTVTATILQFIITLCLAYVSDHLLIALLFLFHYIYNFLIVINLNVFAEQFMTGENISELRGIYLTLTNIGVLMAPFIGSQLIHGSDYSMIFVVSAFLLIPIIVLLKFNFNHLKDPVYKRIDYIGAIKFAIKNINLRGGLAAILSVEIFYTLVSLFVTAYLVDNNIITLSEMLGVVLPIALLPLVILPSYLGILADKKYGEKEMMIIGSILLIALTLLIPFIVKFNITNLFLILLFFLTTRIAAAFIETGATSYYFKKIHPEDSNLISVFGSMRIIARLIVPSIALIVAPLYNEFSYIFYILIALSLLYLLPSILELKDTK